MLVIVRWRGFLEDPEESASHQWSKTLTTTLANSRGPLNDRRIVYGALAELKYQVVTNSLNLLS